MDGDEGSRGKYFKHSKLREMKSSFQNDISEIFARKRKEKEAKAVEEYKAAPTSKKIYLWIVGILGFLKVLLKGLFKWVWKDFWPSSICVVVFYVFAWIFRYDLEFNNDIVIRILTGVFIWMKISRFILKKIKV
jgi:hypothetical protein